MFKDLKKKLETQVTKANQTLYAAIISNDSGSSSRDSGTPTSLINSRDENLENNRSRLDSASSDISQIANYVSPSRQFTTPSDIESEYGGDDNDHEANSKMRKLLDIYKNKFTQLRNAYDEVVHENNHIKDILQKSQDTSIKRQTELREKIKLDRQAKEQLEKEIKLRDNQIEQLAQQLTIQQNSDEEEIRNLREKNTKLEKLLIQCKEAINTHQEKQVNLIIERDYLLQQLNEKQTFIESLMKDRHPENPSKEVKEHFDSDISVLLHDKERLQEQLESTRLCVQQLESNLKLSKQQQQQLNEDIKRERNEFKQKYENLNKELQETILKDQQQIEILKQNLATENEQHLKSFDTLKTEYENLINELHQTKQAKDDIQSLLDQTMNNDKHENTDEESTQKFIDQIDELKATLTKLQHDYEESLVNCTQLTQTLDAQRQENDRIKSQIENGHQKALEILKTEYENTRKEQLSVLEAQDKMTDLSSQISERQEEINRLQQLLNEQKNNSNQYEDRLKEKSSQIAQLEKDFEKLKSQSNLSQKELTNEYNSLQEQLNATTKRLQNELDEKISHINNLEKQLEVKQNEIIPLRTTIDELNAIIKEHEQTIETSQNNDRQLLEQKNKIIDTLKRDHQLEIEKLNQEHQKLTSQLNEKYFQLETKLNNLLSEKSELENELDSIRLQMQTTESTLNEKTNDHNLKLEQTIKEFETERDSYRNEIETLKSEIISLVNINEENTRRIDEFNDEKFNFEQELNEKDRQIKEYDEKIQELELTLERTKENSAKLRNALEKARESMTNNEQTKLQDAENRLRKLTEQYEERLKQQEIEYNTNLKAMAKEMNTQIDEKEQNYNQQLRDFIQNNYKTENDQIGNFQQKIIDAEQRTLIAEKQISKMEEEIKEKQLDHYRIVQDLQIHIQKLTREKPQTTEHFSQTTYEDLNLVSDGQPTLVFEPTEVDYLKRIILAYMTGTDQITMAKVICAVLRYTEDEKTLIIKNETSRQSRWLNSTK